MKDTLISCIKRGMKLKVAGTLSLETLNTDVSKVANKDKETLLKNKKFMEDLYTVIEQLPILEEAMTVEPEFMMKVGHRTHTRVAILSLTQEDILWLYAARMTSRLCDVDLQEEKEWQCRTKGVIINRIMIDSTCFVLSGSDTVDGRCIYIVSPSLRFAELELLIDGAVLSNETCMSRIATAYEIDNYEKNAGFIS